MVNVFGESTKGQRGLEGEKGDSGLGMSLVFFRKTICEALSKNMSILYYFKDKESGFIMDKGKAIGIKNQNSESFKAVGTVGTVSKFEDVDEYYLNFKKEVYVIKGDLDFILASAIDSKSIIMLNFKIEQYPEQIQYIFSTSLGFRQLYIEDKNVVFLCDDIKINLPINLLEWNMIFIEINSIPNKHSTFRVNEESKTFNFASEKPGDDTLFLGGFETNYFQGAIQRFEIFGHVFVEEKPEDLDATLRDSYMRNFYHAI